MTRLRQQDRVLRHLTEQGSINPMTAIREYGIYRLAAVIHLLRKEGFNIITRDIKSKNRYGDVTFYAKYELGSDNKPSQI
tara:strand:+ start:839 stop:1078 length:240 start_codon:yes stop_codon:yes gene_type:complete